jgi:hypothetical protein
LKLQVGRKGYDKGLVLSIDEKTSLDLVASVIDKMKNNRYVKPLGYRFLTLTFAIHNDPYRKGNYSCSISL